MCATNAYATAYGLDQISTERLKDAGKIAPLQIDGAFGDRLSLYSGSVSFENIDVSLPGQGPAVEFRRNRTISDNTCGAAAARAWPRLQVDSVSSTMAWTRG